MKRRIALATSAQLPDLDEDGPALRAALAARGVEGVPAVWDDAAVPWHDFRAVVIRTTWDYAPRRDAFVAWAGRVGDRLYNGPAVVHWNTDKRYLAELAHAGLPTVPTQFVEPHRGVELPAGEVVVKPAVSAGAKDTARYRQHEAARAREQLRLLAVAGRTAMVQPYVASVDDRGETALLYAAGVFSHAIRKAPMLKPGGGFEQALFAPEVITATEATAAERTLGERAVRHASERFGPLPYARVDIVLAGDGEPCISELELTEPSLFLRFGPGAAERFAAAFAALA